MMLGLSMIKKSLKLDPSGFRGLDLFGFRGPDLSGFRGPDLFGSKGPGILERHKQE